MNLFHEYINSTICNCYQLLIKIVSVKSSKSLFKDFHNTVFFKNWTIESFPKLKLQSIEIRSGNSTNFKVTNKWAAVYVQPYLTPCTHCKFKRVGFFLPQDDTFRRAILTPFGPTPLKGHFDPFTRIFWNDSSKSQKANQLFRRVVLALILGHFYSYHLF